MSTQPSLVSLLTLYGDREPWEGTLPRLAWNASHGVRTSVATIADVNIGAMLRWTLRQRGATCPSVYANPFFKTSYAPQQRGGFAIKGVCGA